MPEEFGSRQTCYTRLRRWPQQGAWEDMFAVLKKESDTQEYMIDAAIIKAHPHAAGCLVDALGLPADGRLTGGHRNDMTQAEGFMKGKTPDKLIAGKGYDRDAFREQLSIIAYRPTSSDLAG